MSEQATPFSKKTLYHSNLVAAGTIEGVLITSDVMPSKYKKAGTPNTFVAMKINGKEHQYIVENDTVEAKLKGLKNHVVSLTATGSRDDADISVYDAAGPASAQTSAARAQQPAPANGGAAPATGTPEDTLKHVKALLMRSVAARVYCHDAAILWAEHVQERHPDGEITDEDVRQIGTSLFVMLDKRGLIDGMPWKVEQKGEKKPAPPPPPPPPPPREPEPDEDEIRF